MWWHAALLSSKRAISHSKYHASFERLCKWLLLLIHWAFLLQTTGGYLHAQNVPTCVFWSQGQGA